LLKCFSIVRMKLLTFSSTTTAPADIYALSLHDALPIYHGDRQPADRSRAGDQAVGRGASDEVVEAAPAALGGDGERAVFDEAVGIEQVGDVLAGRASARRVPPLGDLGSAFVQPDALSLDGLGEVGPG